MAYRVFAEAFGEVPVHHEEETTSEEQPVSAPAPEEPETTPEETKPEGGA